MENSDKQFLIYESANGAIEVQLAQDTLWLSQVQIAELFGTKRPSITKHLGNIFSSNELDKGAVCSILEHTASDGKRYKTQHYNLDAIISVGYRVNSQSATRFRQWATARLKEHLVQGYTLNRQRFEANAKELEAAMALLRKTAQSPALQMETSRGLVDIATRYAQTFLLLQRYDEGLLTEPRSEAGGLLLALYEEDLLGFVKETRDAEWQKFCKLYPNQPEQKFLERVAYQLNKSDPNAANKEMRTFGTLGVLRHELRGGTRFGLCQFRPEHELNPDTLARYRKNRLRVVPELVYSPWASPSPQPSPRGGEGEKMTSCRTPSTSSSTWMG